MYYLGPDNVVYDDGRGAASRAYGVDARGRAYQLAAETEDGLTRRFVADHPTTLNANQIPELTPAQEAQLAEIQRSRFPIGDVIARLTGAVGIQPCAPCKRRQEWLNRFGDRIARKVW